MDVKCIGSHQRVRAFTLAAAVFGVFLGHGLFGRLALHLEVGWAHLSRECRQDLSKSIETGQAILKDRNCLGPSARNARKEAEERNRARGWWGEVGRSAAGRMGRTLESQEVYHLDHPGPQTSKHDPFSYQNEGLPDFQDASTCKGRVSYSHLHG